MNYMGSIEAGDKRSYRPSYTLPKAEMHLHASLAMSQDIFVRRLKQGRIANADARLLQDKDARYYPTLLEHHGMYEDLRSVTDTAAEHAEVAQAYLERIAKEGAIYAELSFSYRVGGKFQERLEGLNAGIDAAFANTGITARVMATVLRDHGPEFAEEAAKNIAQGLQTGASHLKHVTGFGLVGDEGKNRLTEYSKAFNIAWHEAGLGLGPHVAEQHLVNAPDFLEALPKDVFNAHASDDPRRLRAGHGTLIHMSNRLMDEFAERNIPLEVCISSNGRIGLPAETKALQAGQEIADTGYRVDRAAADYFRKPEEHPITKFIDRGIPVCLGSDNPFIDNCNIGKEHAMAAKAGVTGDEAHLQMTRTAIEFANVDVETRAGLIEHIENYQGSMLSGEPVQKTVLGHTDAARNIVEREQRDQAQAVMEWKPA